MQLTELDLGDGDPIGTALTILRALGDQALPLAEAQIDVCADRPDLATRWRSIVEAMRTFAQVDAHMKIALDLLDHLDVNVAAAKLDSAIVELGLRTPAETAFQTNRHDPQQGDSYYTHRVQQHLALAGDTADLGAKGRHLDLAARYATLRELMERAIGTDQATRPGSTAGRHLNGHAG